MSPISSMKGEFDVAYIEELPGPLGRKMYVYDGRFQLELGAGNPPDYFELVDTKFCDELLKGDYLMISRILDIDVNESQAIAEALFQGLFRRRT